jgi:hypothetical protein
VDKNPGEDKTPVSALLFSFSRVIEVQGKDLQVTLQVFFFN